MYAHNDSSSIAGGMAIIDEEYWAYRKTTAIHKLLCIRVPAITPIKKLNKLIITKDDIVCLWDGSHAKVIHASLNNKIP